MPAAHLALGSDPAPLGAADATGAGRRLGVLELVIFVEVAGVLLEVRIDRLWVSSKHGLGRRDRLWVTSQHSLGRRDRLGLGHRTGRRAPLPSFGAPALALAASRLALLGRSPAHPGSCELGARAASQPSRRCAAARESSLAEPPWRSARRVVNRSS